MYFAGLGFFDYGDAAMKVHLDDESPLPLEMLLRYLSQSPDTYVFGMFDILRQEDPQKSSVVKNPYGESDLK